MHLRVDYFVVLAFAQRPGVWGWDSLFLGIKVVTQWVFSIYQEIPEIPVGL